jgi:hypothetical protein
MKDRVDSSTPRGIVTHITEALAKIKPTDPLRLVKDAARRKRRRSDSSGNSPAKTLASRWACKKSKRTKSSYTRPEVFTTTVRKTLGSVLSVYSWRMVSANVFVPVKKVKWVLIFLVHSTSYRIWLNISTPKPWKHIWFPIFSALTPLSHTWQVLWSTYINPAALTPLSHTWQVLWSTYINPPPLRPQRPRQVRAGMRLANCI